MGGWGLGGGWWGFLVLRYMGVSLFKKSEPSKMLAESFWSRFKPQRRGTTNRTTDRTWSKDESLSLGRGHDPHFCPGILDTRGDMKGATAMSFDHWSSSQICDPFSS